MNDPAPVRAVQRRRNVDRIRQGLRDRRGRRRSAWPASRPGESRGNRRPRSKGGPRTLGEEGVRRAQLSQPVDSDHGAAAHAGRARTRLWRRASVRTSCARVRAWSSSSDGILVVSPPASFTHVVRRAMRETGRERPRVRAAACPAASRSRRQTSSASAIQRESLRCVMQPVSRVPSKTRLPSLCLDFAHERVVSARPRQQVIERWPTLNGRGQLPRRVMKTSRPCRRVGSRLGVSFSNSCCSTVKSDWMSAAVLEEDLSGPSGFVSVSSSSCLSPSMQRPSSFASVNSVTAHSASRSARATDEMSAGDASGRAPAPWQNDPALSTPVRHPWRHSEA